MSPNNAQFKISNLKLIALNAVYLVPFITASLVQKFSNLSGDALLLMNTVTTLVQAPLMLIILVNFSEKRGFNKLIGFTLTLLMAYSSAALAMNGVNETNLLKVMLVGSIPVFLFASKLFFHFVKISVYENRESTKAFMLSGIVFAFGSYIVLLSMHMIAPLKHAHDIRLLLGMVTLVSTLVISIGLALSKIDIAVVAPQGYIQHNAGLEQWDNFSLTNTPDVLKKGVTDISKYYKLQKSS
jgi:hypothetical protein